MHKNKSDKKNSRTLKRKVNKLRGAKFNVRKEWDLEILLAVKRDIDQWLPRLTVHAIPRNSPEFDPSIHRHSRITRAAYEAVLNIKYIVYAEMAIKNYLGIYHVIKIMDSGMFLGHLYERTIKTLGAKVRSFPGTCSHVSLQTAWMYLDMVD